MKHCIWTAGVLALILVFAGCDSPTDTKKIPIFSGEQTPREIKNGGGAGDTADDNDHENPTETPAEKVSDPRDFAQSITAEDLRKHLYTIASDDYAGRPAGSKKIRRYLRNFYRDNKIKSPPELEKDPYFQTIPKQYIRSELIEAGNEYPDDTYIASLLKHKDELTTDKNVIAYIKGKQNPEEVVIISAHMDHIGSTCDNPMTTSPGCEIYNGANDNGSGTVALLEIAQAFQKAKDSGNIPKRSVMFVHFALEEAGLIGSQYYVENPVFDLKDTVLNLNLDTIGRSIKDRNYIYILGHNEISSELKSIHEEINNKYVELDLDYSISREYLKRGDHFNFLVRGVPALFYFSGLDDWLHKTTDDFNVPSLHYETLAKRTKLALHTAWEFANRAERLDRDGAWYMP